MSEPGSSAAPSRSSIQEAQAEVQKPSGRRLGIAPQIYMGLMGSVVVVLIASFVAYYFLNEIVDYQSRLAEQSIPNLSRSVEVARRTASLVNGAARMAAAGSVEEHERVSKEVFQERDALQALVGELAAGRDVDKLAALVEGLAATPSLEATAALQEVGVGRASLEDLASLLAARLDSFWPLLEVVHESSGHRLAIERSLDLLVDELAEVNKRIERNIVAAMDDQGFFLVEGLRSLEDSPRQLAQRASESELAYYRDLIDISHQTSTGGSLLGEVLSLSDRDLMEPLAERFHSAAQNLQRSLTRMATHTPNEALQILGSRLVEIGEGEEGIFVLRRESLARLAQEREALSAGREASAGLLGDMEKLVAQVNSEAVDVNADSQSAARTGIVLLVALNLLSIGGAFLIGWLFVGRHLVHRMVALAGVMRDMASGDLEAPVAVSGNDEVTDMAHALEVFRRYALEVQRLNLVEKLAEELDAKNQALEHTLEQLRKAQEQMVAEEKLASLGQLTAGVAHEIKNPLNFVRNFAELSAELVEEIGEIIDEAKEDEDLDLAGEIADILDDLKVNLSKVGEHCGRADGIVHSMLEHSRASPGDWRETDLNALLKQYRDLAYHAMRGENQNFNAALYEDLDEQVGLIEVVPQDMSRAFLNILTNALQATEEKREKQGEGYAPELRIGSRHLEDGAEFWVRDNGPGIPEDLRERMFEPFVTTKDTGKGTGLGLSLTVDIITRHGGSVTVDSEEGVYTEMRIRLPLKPADALKEVAHTE